MMNWIGKGYLQTYDLREINYDVIMLYTLLLTWKGLYP